MFQNPPRRAAAALIAPLLLCGVAEATGRYRLPSNAAQFMGYGNGPGYHAPMVLGVLSQHRPPRVRRVLHPPAAPSVYDHGFGHGATLIDTTPHYAPAPTTHYAPTPAYYDAPPAPAAVTRSAPVPPQQRTQSALKRPVSEPRSPSDDIKAESIPLPKK